MTGRNARHRRAPLALEAVALGLGGHTRGSLDDAPRHPLQLDTLSTTSRSKRSTRAFTAGSP